MKSSRAVSTPLECFSNLPSEIFLGSDGDQLLI